MIDFIARGDKMYIGKNRFLSQNQYGYLSTKEAVMEKLMKLLMVMLACAFVLACATGKMASTPSKPEAEQPSTAPTEGAQQAPAAAPQAPETQGFLMEYATMLQPGPEGGVKERWLKPGVDFGKYNKIMLDSITFFFAPDSDYKGIDPQELKDIADKCNKAMVETLNPSYPIVANPGPDVLRIRTAITGLVNSKPVLSGVTSVIPIGLGVSLIKKGSTGEWTGSGATGAEMMMLDSTTNDVLGVARDQKAAGFTERFSKWGSAEDAFKHWANRVKLFMDQAHGVSTEKK